MKRQSGIHLRGAIDSPRIDISKNIPNSSAYRTREGRGKRRARGGRRDRREGARERDRVDCVSIFELRNLKSFGGKL